MGCLALALALALGPAPTDGPPAPANPPTRSRRPAATAEPGRWGWMADPRSAVLLTLGAGVAFGGGRKILKGMRARRASARLAEPDVTPAEIAEAARHGREGLMDLFRLLGTADDPARREAAGRALAALWHRDELIAEEEKALVRRGYSVDWRARRRYPRELAVPIPIRVAFGVPFLREAEGEVGPSRLAWSYRIIGTERASLEEPSTWAAGPGRAGFAIEPADFAGNGPHRLVFQARVRAEGLTERWEVELPHVPFSFEFDPGLRVDALMTLPDEAKGAAIARAVGLRAAPVVEGVAPRFVALADDLMLRDPPALAVAAPLPCDLAHAVSIEFEGVPGRHPAGELIVIGQGAVVEAGAWLVPLDLRGPLPPGSIERPGEVRLRAILDADPHRGWADPDVRSIWPGTIVTEWATARVVRR